MTRAMRAESFTGYGALKGSHMKNAKELLEEFTAASFRDPKKAAEMFTEDGAFEMPYLESFGFPGRYEGREAMTQRDGASSVSRRARSFTYSRSQQLIHGYQL